MRETDDDDDDHKSAPPFATLVAASDEAREVLHVDRTSEECNRVGTKRCALIGPNVELRFSNAVVGRILMAKDNVTRAKMQTADLALDLPSGTFGFFFFAFVRAGERFLCARLRGEVGKCFVVFVNVRFFVPVQERECPHFENAERLETKRVSLVLLSSSKRTQTFTLVITSPLFLLLSFFKTIVSAEHARIVCVKDPNETSGYAVTVTDCSRNGLIVNGIACEKGKPTPLKDQDLIEFPFKCLFKFQVNKGVEPNYGTPKHRLKKGEKSVAPKKRASPEKEIVKEKKEEKEEAREEKEEEKDVETGLPMPPSKKGKSADGVDGEALSKVVEEKQMEIENLKKSIDEVSRERDEFETMNTKLKTDVEEAKKEFEKKQAATKADFEAYKVDATTWKEKCKEEMEDLDKEIERLTEVNGEKMKEIGEKDAKIKSMEENATAMKAAIEKHAKESATMETSVKDLTHRLETSEKELNESKSMLEASKDEVKRWGDAIGKSEMLQANLDEAVKAKEASEKELATVKETLAFSKAAYVEAHKKMMVVGECLHVEMEEEEDEDARVDETMEMDDDDNRTHTTNEQETDNADIHATQVAPPVNEEEEDDEREEERDVVNGDEQNEQVTAPAEAFDPQTQDCVDIEFPPTEVQEPTNEEKQQMQTPAKDDASEETDEGDDMEAKYASMMKKMTPPASETGACDEEEPKEEQEEQVARSTPVVQALVQSAVANVITEDGMNADDVSKVSSLPTPFENNDGLGFTQGDDEEEEKEEKEKEEEEEQEEEDLTLCGEDFVDKTEEIPTSASKKGLHVRFPQTPMSPKNLVIEGEENTSASGHKTFEGSEQQRSPLAKSPIVLD